MGKAKTIVLHNPIEKHLNDITLYHYFMFSLLFLGKIPIFWHVLNLLFLSPPMDYTCVGSNLTNVCPCDEVLWNRSVFTETMQTKFGLYCDTSWLIGLAHSMMYVGLLIGSLLFGFLSDKYGRLCSYTISCLVLGVSGCLLSLMPTAPAFIFMRCIEGIGSGGAIITSFVLCIEYCSVKHRELITALYHIPVNISQLTLPGIAYVLRNFDDFQLAISVPVFLFVLLRWLIMESPKWLMDCERIEDTVMVMTKYGTFNGAVIEYIREEIEEYHAKKIDRSSTKISFFQIFKHKRLTLNICIMSVVYFLMGIGYYGVTIFIGKMSGNIFANVAMSGAVLLPGTIATIFLLQTLPRRTFLIISLSMAGLFMLSGVLCAHSMHMHWLKVVLACISDCFFFMSFTIVFLFGVELFPTSIRNSVLGVLSVLCRLGQISAPLINLSPSYLSNILFGVFALSGTAFVYFLPETKDVELPSSVDDTKSQTRRKSRSIELETNIREDTGVKISEK